MLLFFEGFDHQLNTVIKAVALQQRIIVVNFPQFIAHLITQTHLLRFKTSMTELA
jgi:hypothetical protein